MSIHARMSDLLEDTAGWRPPGSQTKFGKQLKVLTPEQRKQLDALAKQAFEMGRTAHKAGKPSAPMQSKECMDLAKKANPTGEIGSPSSLVIFDAFGQGWHTSNANDTSWKSETADDHKFWASCKKNKVGPCASREDAAKELFEKFPKTREATTGWGVDGPHFDIRWIKNPNPKY